MSTPSKIHIIKTIQNAIAKELEGQLLEGLKRKGYLPQGNLEDLKSLMQSRGGKKEVSDGKIEFSIDGKPFLLADWSDIDKHGMTQAIKDGGVAPCAKYTYL